MRLDVQHYINTVWLLVAIYWVVGIVRAKPTVKRESTLSSALHVAMSCAAVLLVWNPATGIGFLGHRFVSAAGWVQWLGLAVTICGCAFAIWPGLVSDRTGAPWSRLSRITN